MIEQPRRLMYSAREVSVMLGVSYTHTIGLAHAGQLCAVRLGKRILFPTSQVDAALALNGKRFPYNTFTPLTRYPKSKASREAL